MRANLVNLRKKKKHTQASIAKVLDISRGHYASIETGQRTPTMALAYKISEVLGYNFDSKNIFRIDDFEEGEGEEIENND